MARGGRGGGGGSRSFSSGGSRGFRSHSSSSHSSSHSSFSSGRGGRSGGFSSFSGSSYRRPTYTTYSSYRPHGPHFGMGGMGFRPPPPRNNFYYRAPALSFNPLSFIVRTIRNLLIGFLVMIIIIAIASSGRDSTTQVTQSTVSRDKLEASYVNELSTYYTDELGWIGSSSTLQSGMQSFYKQTGVQPYLYICNNIDGDTSGNYTDAQLENFGNEIYDSTFNDEGHVLLVFCEYADSQYNCFCIVGNAAKTVIDEEAQEILLDYVDHYYYSDYDDDEFFSIAFRKAGNDIMHVEKSYGWVVALAIIGIVGVVIILKQIEKHHDKKLEKLKAQQDILNTPLSEFGDDNVENLADKYE